MLELYALRHVQKESEVVPSVAMWSAELAEEMLSLAELRNGSYLLLHAQLVASTRQELLQMPQQRSWLRTWYWSL